jgi:DNA polymerase-3 subunit alpha
MNKLQLEGLVKAGAFDNLNINRHALFSSIPNFILKTKNIFDNKAANQLICLLKMRYWKMISLMILKIGILRRDYLKEFEAVGFFISDHPLNQFTEIFDRL